MSLNQKIVLLVVLIGAVAAIAFFETRSETPNTDDSNTVATSSSDEQTSDNAGLDLTRDSEESPDESTQSESDSSTTNNSEDESTASADSSSSQSSTESSSETTSDSSSDDVTFSGEFATTEHETNESEAVETELTLTPGDEPSSQDGEQEDNTDSGSSAEDQPDDNQLTGVDEDDIPSANADTSSTSSESTSDTSSGETTSSDGFETYEVQSGDNLWKIAKKHYESGSQWKRIKKANSDALSDSNDLKQGQTLRIPTEESLTSTASSTTSSSDSTQDIVVQQESQVSSGSQTLTNGSSGSETTSSDGTESGTETDSPSSYTVQEGDRLWDIVKEQYGSATYDRVQQVADHNEINPRELRPGMELDMPEDLSSANATGSSSTTESSSSGNTSTTDGNPPFEPDSGQTWYRVQDGENLWKISEKEFGSGKHFESIWELNKDRLDDYNSLSSGTWVLLPENP